MGKLTFEYSAEALEDLKTSTNSRTRHVALFTSVANLLSARTVSISASARGKVVPANHCGNSTVIVRSQSVEGIQNAIEKMHEGLPQTQGRPCDVHFTSWWHALSSPDICVDFSPSKTSPVSFEVGEPTNRAASMIAKRSKCIVCTVMPGRGGGGSLEVCLRGGVGKLEEVMAGLKCVDACPTPAPAPAAVIFLHGMGDEDPKSSWENLLFPQSSDHSHVKKIYPLGKPSLVNFSTTKIGWGDLATYPMTCLQDKSATEEAVATINKLVSDLISKDNMVAKRIAIVGFSQGASCAIQLWADEDVNCGGVACVSGWVPAGTILKRNDKKLFFSIGSADKIVNYKNVGSPSLEALEKFRGEGDELRVFQRGGHMPSVKAGEVAALQQFIGRIVH